VIKTVGVDACIDPKNKLQRRNYYMENASKALIMAGGMLLAMMILVLLVYAFTYMNDLTKAQDKKNSTQQIQEFNNEYLAYNKTIMYGTDVITVINKAIDYNSKLGIDDENYKINIILNLIQDFETTKQVVIQKGNGEIKEEPPVRQGDVSLSAGSYQLFEGEDSIKMDDDIINFFHQGSDDKVEKLQGETITTTFTYSAITNFKTAIFECTDVDGDGNSIEYSQEGRIKSMEFSQV